MKTKWAIQYGPCQALKIYSIDLAIDFFHSSVLGWDKMERKKILFIHMARL